MILGAEEIFDISFSKNSFCKIIFVETGILSRLPRPLQIINGCPLPYFFINTNMSSRCQYFGRLASRAASNFVEAWAS